MTVKFTLEYPSDVPTASPEFREPTVMRAIAGQAQALGFDAIALADHPAPSAKWRRAGGHNTFEPVIALAFFAAVTATIRLMTHLYVLPYRNPYLAAKSLTSLDIVSGGRLIAGVGAGYLRSEFAALGVDFDARVRLFDEALTALRRIWTHPEEPISGSNFAATGEVNLDVPIQKPHPPLWIGGNSVATLRRVVEHGSGWSAVIAPASMASSVRTAAIEGVADFSRAVDRLREMLAASGRDPNSVDIQVAAPSVDFDDVTAVSGLDEYVSAMTRAGATHILAHVDASSTTAAETYLIRFAEHFGVIA
ncbi:TIGR03619 family F420-dependent LLM class oxidoreductase [Mycobacterium arosiense]|uniref:LLM class F420-dependent oxidoreductase n=1 Tax=Mycobacterium arosiense ATCC BAA-1401 = DSM 45069 TaxID=1265311 RepID=A0A1W9ZQ34_MYCAI|nr:TIGR03619 family F420-dependent LLM class oxidoreductase [Mycobacterium arosiense]ORA19900.1 LLM class F420-dependent oxidoreductase [Mycobacterium arosiense ATCC BAA-1401 = DSM 45069]